MADQYEDWYSTYEEYGSDDALGGESKRNSIRSLPPKALSLMLKKGNLSAKIAPSTGPKRPPTVRLAPKSAADIAPQSIRRKKIQKRRTLDVDQVEERNLLDNFFSGSDLEKKKPEQTPVISTNEVSEQDEQLKSITRSDKPGLDKNVPIRERASTLYSDPVLLDFFKSANLTKDQEPHIAKKEFDHNRKHRLQEEYITSLRTILKNEEENNFLLNQKLKQRQSLQYISTPLITHCNSRMLQVDKQLPTYHRRLSLASGDMACGFMANPPSPPLHPGTNKTRFRRERMPRDWNNATFTEEMSKGTEESRVLCENRISKQPMHKYYI